MDVRKHRRGTGNWRVVVTTVALLASGLGTGTSHASGTVQIEVLSSRADLVSGGDTLVEVVLPSGVASNDVAITIDGRDVSSSFAIRPNGRFEGFVDGLTVGPNTLTATLPDGHGASLTLTNHEAGGPLFSGPQIQPWGCHAGAKDAKCNDTPTYSYFYMPANVPVKVSFPVGLPDDTRSLVEATSLFQPFDPSNPPPSAAIATTTTDEGKTVPYIIRQENGWLNRDTYAIAVLYDPAQPDQSAWNSPPAWNHKMVIIGGGGCRITQGEGTAPSVQAEGPNTDSALSRGFLLMSTSMANSGQNCNVITQAESLTMAKERVVEQYGEIRYTIGSGCSGGALSQHQVANAYPGIFDGILPQCSYPDAWSTMIQVEDYQLMREYFENPSRWGTGVIWNPKSIADVDGHPSYTNPYTFSGFSSLFRPQHACGVPAEDMYDPQTNPHGVRCTFQDYMVNVFGKRASDGFAGRPIDNVGVQYGLNALRSDSITPAQFVDLNTKIGSHDIDYNPQPVRVAADTPALENAYRSGAMNEGNGLKDVAIIDLRGPDHPGAIHDTYRTFAMRARLQRSNGTYANQVVWEGAVPLWGGADFATLGIVTMDRWLAAVEADTRDIPKSQKIIEDRPADIQDHCTDGVGQTIPDQRVCHTINPVYRTPRMVAGAPYTDDVWKCQLRPLNPADYYPHRFTDAEWAALEVAFPSGVCDYSVPGVGQQPTIPWLTYQNDAAGDPQSVIYGGLPISTAPRSSPF